MQSGLAVLSALAILWWGWGLYYFCLLIGTIRFGVRPAKETAQRIGTKWSNKCLPSLTAALTDFQKAQCFFMLAINIAAQVNRGNGGFQPKNLQELYNNYILIKAISIAGFLPITFMLFMLHIIDMVSWYLILLSVCTVGLSTATLSNIGNFVPTQTDLDFLAEQSKSGGPASCGGNNLLVYCLTTIENSFYWDPSNGAFDILAFCLVVLVLLIMDQANLFRHRTTRQVHPWLLKTRDFIVSEFVGIRGLQLVLVLLCIHPGAYDAICADILG